jgi:hypothetical protein
MNDHLLNAWGPRDHGFGVASANDRPWAMGDTDDRAQCTGHRGSATNKDQGGLCSGVQSAVGHW